MPIIFDVSAVFQSTTAAAAQVISDGQCPSLACPFLFTLSLWHDGRLVDSAIIIIIIIMAAALLHTTINYYSPLYYFAQCIYFIPPSRARRTDTPSVVRYRFHASLFLSDTLSIYKWTSAIVYAKQWNRCNVVGGT